MEADELTYNTFYHQLRVSWNRVYRNTGTKSLNALLRNTRHSSMFQEKFRRKYEFAVSKCWTICVPCSDSLKGLTFTDAFVGKLL